MRKFLLALLLLASPLSAQVTITGMTLEDVTITAVSATTPATNWSSSFIAVYDFEASGDPWGNADAASGGSGCDMSITGGTPTRVTGTYVKATASAYMEDAAAEGDVLASTCADLDDNLDDVSVTWGAWTYPENDNFGSLLGATSGNNGYDYRRDSASDRVRCMVGGGTALTNHYGDNNELPTGAWTHGVCVYDHGGQTVASYENGAASSTNTSAHTDGLVALDPSIGGAIGAWDRNADEAFVYAGVLSAAEIARVAACGVDGADCTCNGTAYTDYGKTDESCTGSATPWECCTGSGTGCVDQDLLTDDCNKASP